MRGRLKLLFLLTGTVSAFMLGYSAVAHAWPYFGRQQYYGFFTGTYDDQGGNILDSSVPSSINTTAEFFKYIEVDLLQNGNARERVGAAFIIQTMTNGAHDSTPSAAVIADWENRVEYAQYRGWINWNVNYSYTINSFWQGSSSGPNPNDDSFFAESGSGAAITFSNGSSVVYAIRRACANPVGRSNLGPLPEHNFSMSGRVTVSDSTPAPGDTITFKHYVKNNGPDTSGPTRISTVALRTLPTTATVGGPSDSGIFTSGQEKNVFNINVAIPANAAPNTQYCQRVGYDPTNDSGGRNGRSAIVCATVQANFTLRPAINVLVNGVAPAAGSVAEQGDNVEFRYTVVNSGLTGSTSVNCTVFSNNINGYHTAPTPPESTSGWAIVGGTGCPRTFPTGSTLLPASDITASVPAGNVNKSMCRVLTINPASVGGGAVSVEACVQIGAKPYMRVYGGDVSAGNGQPTTCSSVNSGIIGWNKESPTFSGAGGQYAVMAIGQINDFASTLGNSAGATPPSSLAFANTTANPPNIFGGSFGSLPCIQDYYSHSTGVATGGLPGNNLSVLSGKNNYTATGPITLGGNIAAGQQTVIFVNGDVLITGNIVYPASWRATGVPPVFQLIAKGNIYISQNVTRLDGVYIAQPTTASSTTSGIIFTCANPALPVGAVQATDTGIYTKCQNGLSINGAFVAKQVQFLRTRGTLSLSAAAETGSSTNIAEVFNYGPAFWIGQPEGPPSKASIYDFITALPPIL